MAELLSAPTSTPPPPSQPPQKPLRIGTRKSKLAIVQAEGIRDRLQLLWPSRSFEIVALHTIGDKDKTTALYDFGAKSLWTSELVALLVGGELDVVVHCLKDMPTQLPATCALAATPLRDDPRDALIVKSSLPYTTLASLPPGSIVGTSSVRRSAQLRRLHPHLRFANLRGNVETRLAKVDDPAGEYACMIMSACGLQRLGLGGRITQFLGREEGMLYAVGQGALGLEVRSGDGVVGGVLGGLGDRRSGLACGAERALMRRLEGGCSVPIGVETDWAGEGVLRMRAVVVSVDGVQCVEDALEKVVRSDEEGTALGEELAARLVEGGAGEILKSINANRPAKD